MPDTTIQVVLNVSAESVKVGDRVWLDCVVTGDANAKIEFHKMDADELPANAQVCGHLLDIVQYSTTFLLLRSQNATI